MVPSASSHRQAAMEKVAFVSSPGLPLISNFKVVGSHPLNRSFHLSEQLPRVAQHRLNLLSLGDCVLREAAVRARVLVSPWRAGFRRTAVHAAAPSAAHRRRAARAAAADFLRRNAGWPASGRYGGRDRSCLCSPLGVHGIVLLCAAGIRHRDHPGIRHHGRRALCPKRSRSHAA